jgi:hypothetical protein
MMEALEVKLAPRDIPFDATDRHVMCFGHIIDLCSGRVIRHVEGRNLAPPPSLLVDDDINPSNPIALARSVVGAIRASSTRRDAFNQVITDGNQRGYFMEGDPPKAVTLSHAQLLRDVQTRWDSVFLMLRRLRSMRLVSTDLSPKLTHAESIRPSIIS